MLFVIILATCLLSTIILFSFQLDPDFSPVIIILNGSHSTSAIDHTPRTLGRANSTCVYLHVTMCLSSTSYVMLQVFLAEDAELVGNSSVEVNNALLCSFYGEFTDTRSGERVEIPSVQCVKGQAWSASELFSIQQTSSGLRYLFI